MNESNNNSSKLNVIGLLGVLFVGLKLTGYINWSWWYVTLPFWGSLAMLLVFLLVGGIWVLFKNR